MVSKRMFVASLLPLALSLLAAPYALAVDGVTLINQATVTGGLPGCPNDGSSLVTICNSGSYRLASDLNGIDRKNGIDINANNVTLDLNGFTIFGQFGNSFGILSSDNQITVINGTVNQYYTGIYLVGLGSTVERVTVSNARDFGLQIAQGEVRYCTLLNNGYAGVIFEAASGTAPGGQVSDSEIFGGNYGVYAQTVTAVSVQHNFIQGSGYYALFFNSASGPYGLNTFSNIGSYNAIGGTSLGNNFCSSGTVC